MTFADAINANGDASTLVAAQIKEINDACKRHPNSPRDAGVAEPWKIAAQPLRLVKLDVIDRDSGEMTIDSPWGVKTVTFSPDDDIEDFCSMDLLEAL